MKRLIHCATAAAALSLVGCMSTRDPGDALDEVDRVGGLEAEIADAAGRTRATATVIEAGDSIRVRIEATSLSAGAYGAHLHAAGRCDAPAFESAGPHWNPTAQQHGKDNPQGMHKGDLPNLLVGADGQGSLEYSVLDARLSGREGLLDGDGAALVIHARPDDYRTDPSGNSGTRIACGVLD